MRVRSGAMVFFLISVLMISGYTDLDSIENVQLTTDPYTDFKCELIVDSNLLELAKSGELPGIDISIGMSKQEILNSFGKPDLIGKMHTIYYKYDGCIFYFGTGDQIGVMDIKLNMSPSQLKEIIGEPDFEGISPIDSYYSLIYSLENNYMFYIDYKTKDSPEGMLRYKIN
ncbi:DUF4309 domain-containing protein [Chengkuizengella marina]|uniref:DUF4309 domain-containing protein n=1 Tax=Chengkuizengella marina TaxID=2507566 RepID=UPI00136F9430|nr:DUF4309 domain-containing protein [Chengkuizengella marina]